VGSSPTPGMMPQSPTSTFATFLWVGLGGAIGSSARFGLGEIARRIPVLSEFPWATLAINIIGSLILGWFLRWAELHGASASLRAFVAIGICGGFTTFSTFASENAVLLSVGAPTRALAYALASVLLSVGAIFVGHALGRA
jgi:CrcB protein